MEKYKAKLLKSLKQHINIVRQKVLEKVEVTKILASQSLKELGKLSGTDQVVFLNGRANAEKRLIELAHLERSPFFMKCIVLNEKGEEKKYYFAQHGFSEQAIYSWVAPVSTIRFENLGKASYKLPNGVVRNVTIKQKEQYMIVDGKIIFFSIEKENKPRELIYQEHFTTHKSSFILPEIVAQMEKAQDQVIRANHKGALVISGPAGSGKTTLALHRVAYLTQAPETALIYSPTSIIVFVQDISTKEYFATLLPSLGIDNIHITTFSLWALKILDINNFSYDERYGENEEERDFYEYQKLQILRENSIPGWNKDIFRTLGLMYRTFSKNNLKIFSKQKSEMKLDRFDLIILLKSYFLKYKKYETKREYQTFIKHNLIQKTEKSLIAYSLMVIDEFQNYLPEQLAIFRNCLNEETKSTIYVGDIAQQVKLGTIKNLYDLGENISLERNIRLSKVYRNTKNILSYIQSLGFFIEIPNNLKDGSNVIEKITNTINEEIEHIKRFIPKYKDGTIGILAKDEKYLEIFKNEFRNSKNIHILTMLESQGVEFDLVFIVGINKDTFLVKYNDNVLKEHIEERKRMQKDLLYVALTRAISELHVLGLVNLKEIL